MYPKNGEKASLFLMEGLKSGGLGLNVESPLFVYDEMGEYTPELLRAYGVEGLTRP